MTEIEPIKTERIDNNDGTYTVKEIYDKPTDDNYLSCIETFDNNDKILNAIYYKDNSFKTIEYTIKREYNEDGSYKQTQINIEKAHYLDYLASISYFNSENQRLKTDFYSDTDFKNHTQTDYFEYLQDMDIYKVVMYNDKYSFKKYFNKQKQLIKSILYEDINFNNIGVTDYYEYNNDGSHIEKSIYYSDSARVGSGIMFLDKNDRLIKAQNYYDKNFTEFHSLFEYRYNKDNSYVEYTTYAKPNENGWLSYINKYDSEDNSVEEKYYKDTNFKKLGLQINIEYLPNDEFIEIDKKIETDFVEDYKYKSYIEENYNNKKWIRKYYANKNFTHLILTTEGIYNEDK